MIDDVTLDICGLIAWATFNRQWDRRPMGLW